MSYCNNQRRKSLWNHVIVDAQEGHRDAKTHRRLSECCSFAAHATPNAAHTISHHECDLGDGRGAACGSRRREEDAHSKK